MFPFFHSLLIIFLLFNFILIKFGCLSSKSFVILRDENEITDNEKIKGLKNRKNFQKKSPNF
ncbi:unnamed protein product [Meloidogyne enterolobii]|uniref:Uncharacterized protein n=1 Tax=Meloidogyne enterolobii TaxID=390850 RepID=A0ACB0XZL7_MELEN